MKTKPEIKKQRLQSKLKLRRSAKKKAAYASFSKGLRVVQQVFKTIVHFYPALFDEMREIEDYRQKSLLRIG